MSGRKSSCGRTGSAGEGLPHTPLTHPHSNSPDSVVYEWLPGHNKLDIDALSWFWLHIRSTGEIETIELLILGQDDYGVGIRKRNAKRWTRHVEAFGAHVMLSPVQLPAAKST